MSLRNIIEKASQSGEARHASDPQDFLPVPPGRDTSSANQAVSDDHHEDATYQHDLVTRDPLPGILHKEGHHAEEEGARQHVARTGR